MQKQLHRNNETLMTQKLCTWKLCTRSFILQFHYYSRLICRVLTFTPASLPRGDFMSIQVNPAWCMLWPPVHTHTRNDPVTALATAKMIHSPHTAFSYSKRIYGDGESTDFGLWTYRLWKDIHNDGWWYFARRRHCKATLDKTWTKPLRERNTKIGRFINSYHRLKVVHWKADFRSGIFLKRGFYLFSTI